MAVGRQAPGGAGPGAGSPPPRPASVLVGRDPQAAVLASRLDALGAADAGTHPAGAVVLLGPAGIGKSRLLGDLAARARARGLPVLTGRAVPGSGPFRPWVEALVGAGAADVAGHPEVAPHLGVLARLLPGWSAHAGAGAAPHLTDQAVVIGEAFLALLRAVGGERGVVVTLDDLHWADPDSLAVLDYVSGAAPGTPALLAVAARDDEQTGLDGLRRRPGVTWLALPHLDAGDVVRLAEDRLGGRLADDARHYLVQNSDGLPLLAEELLTGMVEAGDLRRDAQEWRAAGALAVRVPSTLAGLVGQRLAALDPVHRQIVEAAAVLGPDVDETVVAAVTLQPLRTVLTALRAAVEGHLLVLRPEGLAWRHALTREAVLVGLLPVERRLLAADAARILLADASAPQARRAQAADLLETAGDGEAAAAVLADLAEAATASGAIGSAETMLRRALRLLPADAGPQRRVRAALVRVLALAGRTADAVETGDALLPLLDGDEHRALCLGLARAVAAADDFPRAQEYLDRIGPTPDPQVRSLGAAVRLGLHDLEGAVRLAHEAVTAARSALAEGDGGGGADADALCEGLTVLGRALRPSAPDDGEDAFRDAIATAARHGRTVWRIRALSELGASDGVRRGSSERLHEAYGLARQAGMLATAAMLQLQIAAVTSATRGHVAGLPWARGSADLSRALGLQGPRAAVLVFVAIGMVYAGEEGEEDVLEQALACAPPHADTHAMVPCVRAVRAWLSGDVPRAIDEFRVGLVEAGHAEVSPWWGMWVLMRYAADPADREGVDFVRASGVLTHPGNPAALDLADALQAARSGRDAEARALLARGEERLAAFPFWLRQLRCVLAPAAAEVGLGDPVAWLRDALAAFEEDGEVRLAAHARDLLRRSGAPVPRRRTDGDGVPTRWRALGVTAREAQVLDLVRQGRSNAEIAAELVVSVRTVETHVSSLLAKTGTSSRAGLAAV